MSLTKHEREALIRALEKNLKRAREPNLRERLAAAIQSLKHERK